MTPLPSTVAAAVGLTVGFLAGMLAGSTSDTRLPPLPRSLLAQYDYGFGWRRGDVLVRKQSPYQGPYATVGGKVVVIEQSALSPSNYKVVGEPTHNGQEPSWAKDDKFIVFTINGYEWERAK